MHLDPAVILVYPVQLLQHNVEAVFIVGSRFCQVLHLLPDRPVERRQEVDRGLCLLVRQAHLLIVALLLVRAGLTVEGRYVVVPDHVRVRCCHGGTRRRWGILALPWASHGPWVRRPLERKTAPLPT